jgi:acyl transferase domain-containing protein
MMVVTKEVLPLKYEGQAIAISKTIEDAQVSPNHKLCRNARHRYALGDPIEIEGLKWLLEFSPTQPFCAGSIKATWDLPRQQLELQD